MVNQKMNAKNFFSSDEKGQIVRAIKKSELETSGEICVHLDARGKTDVMERAKETFQKLGIIKTKHRNGILIYLSLSDQKFAIIGDQGIHNRVGDKFWADAAENMSLAFSKGEFLKGVVDTINGFGGHLKKHFPREVDDKNELPNLN